MLQITAVGYVQTVKDGTTQKGNFKRKLGIPLDIGDKDDEVTEWVNTTLYGDWAKRVTKGTLVFLSGRVEGWTHNGNEYKQVQPDTFRVLKYADNGGQQQQPQTQSQGGFEDNGDDDLPF